MQVFAQLTGTFIIVYNALFLTFLVHCFQHFGFKNSSVLLRTPNILEYYVSYTYCATSTDFWTTKRILKASKSLPGVSKPL